MSLIALHHLDRARRAGHDPRAQRGDVVAGEVGVVQLGDEHRRHAVERGAAFRGHRLERRAGVERRGGDDHARAVGDRAEVAHHHAEAVVEGHGDADAVGLRVAAALADEVAVVEDVAMAERRALRRAGRAAGVLDVDGVAGRQLRLAGGERVRRDLRGAVEEAVPRRVADPDHVIERRRLGRDLGDHRLVVGGLEGARGEQQPCPRLAQRVGQLGGAVGGVDVDEDRADAGGGQLQQRPLRAVGAPDADAVAGGDAVGQERERQAVGLGVELRVAQAHVLVAADERLARAVALGHPAQVGADRLVQQGGRLRPADVGGGHGSHHRACGQPRGRATVSCVMQLKRRS
jgi:hypothetical protein